MPDHKSDIPNKSKPKNLPVVINDDRGLIITKPDKVKQGQMGAFVDGRWSPRGGEVFPPGTRMLFRGMVRAVQGWHHNELIGEFIEWREELPDIDELNKQIPRDTWDLGFDGPREPYALFHVVYLTNKSDGATYTFSLPTYGQKLAYDELQTKLAIDAAEGKHGIPEIELHSKVMSLRRGPKQRPFYEVVGHFGDDGSAQQQQPIKNGPTSSSAPRQIEQGKSVKRTQVNMAIDEADDEPNDELPW